MNWPVATLPAERRVRLESGRDPRILPLRIASLAKQLCDDENHDGAAQATSCKQIDQRVSGSSDGKNHVHGRRVCGGSVVCTDRCKSTDATVSAGQERFPLNFKCPPAGRNMEREWIRGQGHPGASTPPFRHSVLKIPLPNWCPRPDLNRDKRLRKQLHSFSNLTLKTGLTIPKPQTLQI